MTRDDLAALTESIVGQQLRVTFRSDPQNQRVVQGVVQQAALNHKAMSVSFAWALVTAGHGVGYVDATLRHYFVATPHLYLAQEMDGLLVLLPPTEFFDELVVIPSTHQQAVAKPD